MATTQKTFLRFREQPAKGTTSIHAVLSIANDTPLGVIKWRSGWRRYVFEPCDSTVFDAGCLKEIVEFITNLMLDRDPAARYNPTFGNDRICVCTHTYYRHFDWMETDRPDYVPSCKYCGCGHFKEQR